MTEPNKRQKAVAWRTRYVTPVLLGVLTVLMLLLWWRSEGWSGTFFLLIGLFSGATLYKHLSTTKE